MNKKKGRRRKLSKETEKDTELEKEENTSAESEETKAADETAEKADENAEDNKAESEEDKLRKELADAKDKYLRLMAEYDNFRKRSAKERLELTDTAKGNVINGFLPVFDNFERALGTETQDTVYKQGVEMIFNQFGEALKKLNVEVMDILGKEFDPNIATAVSTVDDPELGENVVAQVLQNGYTIGGKVIRHAMVIVANP
ncbi:nucleotide exchange factor GrpE [Ruminococcus sp.]|uniref:nucleotide exchange factor GrpE n=1 Tax=Ruminococcus sp. TaxID=41978 RepID=UPI0025F3B72D|nr:nucleotide exchange factor GrpE [Ruminococcus sp.]